LPALITPRFGWLDLYELELVLLDLLRGPTQGLSPCCPMAVDFAQNGIAAHLCGRNHSIDTLDVVEIAG
jgi:hypothetical protein